jgi:hypothetical protein
MRNKAAVAASPTCAFPLRFAHIIIPPCFRHALGAIAGFSKPRVAHDVRGHDRRWPRSDRIEPTPMLGEGWATILTLPLGGGNLSGRHRALID